MEGRKIDVYIVGCYAAVFLSFTILVNNFEFTSSISGILYYLYIPAFPYTPRYYPPPHSQNIIYTTTLHRRLSQ